MIQPFLSKCLYRTEGSTRQRTSQRSRFSLSLNTRTLLWGGA